MHVNHGFVKAYSNNWLSQFGVYKYASPNEPPPKPDNRHRTIAIYCILGMAAVLFFTIFVIIHETERETRKLIVASFSNETAIESSASQPVLTTPFSANQSLRILDPVNSVGNGSWLMAQKRTRRLGGFDQVEHRTDQLVFLPSAQLKPPKVGPRRKWAKEGPVIDESRMLRDKETVPRPFHFSPKGAIPVGFQKPNRTVSLDVDPFYDSEGSIRSIQDIIRQLSASRQQHYQLYQPAEFNHPMYRNHRVKFTGTYRHPRKNGDITTLFGDATHQRDVHIQKPQAINNQLAVPSDFVPDPLYNFKPRNPSDVNLLATEQFRFAPENPSAEEKRPTGMPFSLMLDLEPMPDGSYGVRRPRKMRYNAGLTHYPASFNNQNFAQVQPHFNRFPQHLEHNVDEQYFRKVGRLHRTSPFDTGKLMVHLNLYPKKTSTVAGRKSASETVPSLNGDELPVTVGTSTPWTRNFLPQHDVQPDGLAPTVPMTGANLRSPAEISSTEVEIIRSIEVPTKINFDHVPLGRHPLLRNGHR